MSLDSVLQAIKKTFFVRKTVDFNEIGLHVELEPLTSMEEVKVMESLKDIDESRYIEALKRHSLALSIRAISLNENDKVIKIDLSKDLVEYIDEGGAVKTKSKFLYMLDYLGQWPGSIIDVLFEAYTNMNEEIDDRIRRNSKFEFFKLSDKPAEDKEQKIKPLLEEDDDELPKEEMTETERLNLKVKKELEREEQKIAQQG